MVLDDAEQQIFLRVEVVVDRALRDARRLGDVVETRVPISALREHVERGLEQLSRPLVRPALPPQRLRSLSRLHARAVMSQRLSSNILVSMLLGDTLSVNRWPPFP